MDTPILRLAFLADIHGNLPALEAVLADVRPVPGCSLSGGRSDQPLPVAQRGARPARHLRLAAIAGNHELVIGIIGTPHNYPPFTDRNRFAVLWWTWETLAPRHLRHSHAPEQLHIHIDGAPPILMTHGTPGDAEVGFYPGFDDDTMRRFLVNVDEARHRRRPHPPSAGSGPGPVAGVQRRRRRAALQRRPAPSTFCWIWRLPRTGPTWTPCFRQVDYDRLRRGRCVCLSGLLDAAGPLARLDLRTVQTGHPWTSDFGVWMRSQPKSMRADMSHAVDVYCAPTARATGPLTNRGWPVDDRTPLDQRRSLPGAGTAQ
ncbi:MAG: metallophosphoesterase [Caldilineaceae bacterium]